MECPPVATDELIWHTSPRAGGIGSANVSVINTTTNTVVATVTVGTNPAAVAVSPDGHRVYVSNNASNTITVIDPATDTTVGAPIAMPGGPAGLGVSADGHTLYVAGFSGSNVTVYDLVAQAVITTVPVGNNPTFLAIRPDGAEVAVACEASAAVYFINTATNTAAAPVAVGFFPNSVAYSPDGSTIYVPRFNADDVSMINAVTHVLAGTTITVGDSPYPLSAFMSPPIITSLCTGCATPLQIANDAALTPLGVGKYVIFNNGNLRITGNWTTTRTLSLIGDGTINTNGFNATINGDIIGVGGLQKNGTGTLALNGTAAHDGGTNIQAGTLLVNGTHTSGPMFVGAGATLGGTGTIGAGFMSGAANVAPGANGPGTLHVTNNFLFSAAAHFIVELNGPVAGTGYDRLEVGGTVQLSNTNLQLSVGYVPAPGTVFTIVTNASGIFNGLPENTLMNVGGRRFRISYLGGDGNDVTLTYDGPPTIAPVPTQTMFNGGTLPLTITIGDDTTPAGSLGLAVSSTNATLFPPSALTLGGSGSARTLTITPPAGQIGTGQITLTATDSLGQTTTLSFEVDVLKRAYHLAEGATGAFFSTDLLLANPNSQPARTTITFFKENGSTVVLSPTLAATSRTTIRVGDVAGMESTAFSTVVESPDGWPLAVERTMWWDNTGYGSHTEKASAGPALSWNFAEGSQGYFHTYFLLLNPNATDTVAHVTFVLEGAAPVMRDYAVPASSRRTIDCAAEPALANQSFGAVITFDAPGMAERAMYFGDAPLFSGGHASAGVNMPSTSWFLAEGATGSFFDTFVLIANPQDATANITLKYLLPSGEAITKPLTLAGHQRFTINIATENASLASAAVSTQVTSDIPILVERSQYWPHGGWYEAHNSAGETSPELRWGLAEGRVGGTNNAQTYILVANPNSTAVDVTATFLRGNGTTVVKHFNVPATSRFNIAVVSGGGDAPELVDESFGTVIEATQPVMVERSFYTDANGVTWAAGTNATGTRLP